mgnify:CR=1 FL=1
MTISLITVTYNSGNTLFSTLQSVLSQTHLDIEYIIVDGVSKDHTIDVLKEYGPKFNGRLRWISEPDKGLYDAMNKGIRMATGDVVGILNSDDFFTGKDLREKDLSFLVEQFGSSGLSYYNFARCLSLIHI